MKAILAFFLCVFCGLCSAAPPDDFCSWDHPGSNKYQDLPVNALRDYYMDYRVRATLQVKMINHWYDDIVEIRRDGVTGNGTYSNMRDMHYGKGSYCPGRVDTGHWNSTQVERALVYCVAEVCVAVPTVCNNVSLIDRGTPIDVSPSASGGSDGAPVGSIDTGAGELGPQPGVANGPTNPGADATSPEGEIGSGGYYGGLGPIYGGGGEIGGSPGPPASGPDCGRSSPPVCPGLGCGLNPPVSAVPEPAEWAMIAAGLVCFIYLWSRRQR